MIQACGVQRAPSRRHGAAAIFTVVMLVVLIGFASLTIDVGAMYNTRADLQNAADAAALAAAAAYASSDMMQVRLGKDNSGEFQEVMALGRSMARQAAIKNWSFGGSGTELADKDIVFGWIDVTSGTSQIDPSAAPSQYNAVQVITRRSAEINGPLNFFFASIFGKNSTTVTASAVAAYVANVTVYDVAVPESASVWPFTIHEDEYVRWIDQAVDNYAYFSDDGDIRQGSDGEVEVRIYPDKLAPGNYGLLNIGTPNQSTTMLEQQILDGVSPADLELEIGSSQLSFLDSEGNPSGYYITGNPGLKSALEESIKLRYGDVVAFFVHDGTSGGGSKMSYHVTGLRFARVMYTTLRGKQKRGLWMQPVNYSGPGIVSQSVASNGIPTGIMLVR